MDITVKLNLKGINALMTSRPVVAEVAARAHRMAREAGEGFEAVVKPHRYTARAYVQTDLDNPIGAQRQAAEHVLERVLGVAPGIVQDNGKLRYKTKDGRTIWATQAQINNWTSGRKR